MTRRRFLQTTAAGVATMAQAQSTTRSVPTPVLDIGYEESGSPQGFPVILLHGFPDDAHAYDRVAPPLAKAGHRVLVPYLRGYGPTRFRDTSGPRTAEQAAIGQDVIDFADALGLKRFSLAGYDWGGRAACITAALHPERVRAAVIIGGYLIQNVFAAPRPAPPELERELWYQWYFNTERGRVGLAANRRSLCKLLWQGWSPGWHFSDEEYNLTAASFDNPDFVDCVIHSYRHRNGNAAGEERFLATEHALAKRPKIAAPTILLYGAADALVHPAPDVTPGEREVFPSLVARRVIAGAGHFLPRENPQAVSDALLQLLKS
jgi:pimeloyl-ACP methyl ester carboxylesterase